MLKYSQVIAPLITLVLFVTTWELGVKISSISPLILPSLSSIFSKIIEQFGYLITNGAVTLLESVLGFLLGLFLAITLSTVFVFYPIIEQALYPYLIGLRAIPLVAIAPLIILWVGGDLFSKVLLAAIISFFPILINTIQGMKSLSNEELELMAMLSATSWQTFLFIRVKAALPYLFSGMKIASTFAVIGAIVAEFTGAIQGIGYVIKSSSYYLDTSLTFAAIAVAALIGILFFFSISLLEKKVVFWQTG
jgi:NitT/TauT family transport system permease protein